MIQEANFSRLLAHAGWGDPANGLWFVGIEEGGTWNGPANCVENWFDERQSVIRKVGRMTYESGTSCEGVSPASGSRIRYWEQAIVDRVAAADRSGQPVKCPPLWSPGSRVFHANLNPLSRPTVSDWPDYFGSLFGLSTRESYKRAVEDVRYPMLREARIGARPQATICFGKSRWPDFELAFGLDRSSAQTESRGKIVRYEKDRALGVPFFGYWHMNSLLSDDIAAILREWGLDLGYQASRG